ncbi:MAG: 2-amino-4-hydroxy-6-hydroxymethyldihydropteridine diphosphokinase [Candidatus Hydrogenedentes bacterium]|nr:2-amino-4-hydroxy-6-hydroxymethyldihydropteridine diphosphokinase [Candidatus Hydrogenedentota bacterium]
MDKPNKRTEAIVSVGSNIEPELNIPQAMTLLRDFVDLEAVSTFYRTAPLGRPEQPAFLNGVCLLETEGSPRWLKFEVLRHIESELGRERTTDKFAPRSIDLDIALFGEEIVQEPGLRVPDPDIRERPFLALPIYELRPETVLPDTGEALADIVAVLPETGMVADTRFTDLLRARLLL